MRVFEHARTLGVAGITLFSQVSSAVTDRLSKLLRASRCCALCYHNKRGGSKVGVMAGSCRSPRVLPSLRFGAGEGGRGPRVGVMLGRCHHCAWGRSCAMPPNGCAASKKEVSSCSLGMQA